MVHIHKYKTPIFANIVVYVSKPINQDNQILWRLWNIVRFDMQIILLHRKQDFWNVVAFLTLLIPAWKRYKSVLYITHY